MKKSFKELARIAAGLGAAYALTKMGKSPEEKGLDIARSETRDMTSDEALAPRKAAGISDAKRMANQAAEEDASRAAFAQANKPRDTFASDTLERGSVAAFKQDEANRRARIEAQRLPSGDRRKALAEFDEKVKAYNSSLRGFQKGGSVVARGNKLARSKPTKLF